MEDKYIKKIIKAVQAEEDKYPSNYKLAHVLDINPSQLSLILRNKTDRVLSTAKWMSIARRLDVNLKGAERWKVAKTPVFNYIYQALSICQQDSLSGLLCDRADIGKTFTAREYVKSHTHAVYIDCSQVKTKRLLVKKISREFGLTTTGQYTDIYADLVFYLSNGVENPLIVLDEAGDLDSQAFLEVKALWNATERSCGWYMMGADGLKAKIERNLDLQTVGYTETFSRYGSRYQKIVPNGKKEAEDFIRHQIAAIAIANGATNIQEIYARSGGSLRRIFTEVQKMKRNEKSPERDATD